LVVAPRKETIGALGALSIGVGGIVGGGFFATFGLTAAGAGGGTPLAFLLGGILALLTAWSYVGLTLRFPGPGGTVAFISQGFGRGFFAATVNVLLIFSYVAIMAVYASALAGYIVPFLPEALRAAATHVLSSAALILLGLVNFFGTGLMGRLEGTLNTGKLMTLGLFILIGLTSPGLDLGRLAPEAWAPPIAIIASGMIGFLAYEGFELIANASGDVKNPRRALPVAFMGSVLIAIVIYCLAFVVGLGHLPLAELIGAKSFGISAAAASFLGQTGFIIMAISAVLASASAITADYFGAARLPPELQDMKELPSALHRDLKRRGLRSLIIVGILAILAVNVVSIEAMSAATSGGFLIVFAAVNAAAFRLASVTGAHRLVPALGTILCCAALAITVWQLVSTRETADQAGAMAGIVILALGIEAISQWLERRPSPI
jgi:amino acid transporter